jgi:hypothetical protein
MDNNTGNFSSFPSNLQILEVERVSDTLKTQNFIIQFIHNTHIQFQEALRKANWLI